MSVDPTADERMIAQRAYRRPRLPEVRCAWPKPKKQPVPIKVISQAEADAILDQQTASGSAVDQCNSNDKPVV